MVGYKQAGQLPLPVRLDDSATLDNFFLPPDSPNGDALGALRDSSNMLSLYLWGDTGAGVSHLLQALCHGADLQQQTAIYIPLDEFLEQSPELMLADLESMSLVCIDGIDGAVKGEQWSEQLFHLFNRAHANTNNPCRLVFGAKASPANIETPLADLQSRLSSMLTYRVTRLTDQEKMQALIFRANRRGMEMPMPVAQYLITHYRRELSEQFRILDQLDQATLLEKRKLTVPFVKSILEERDEQSG